ncbi:MAG: hypothetical protein QGI86_18745 [Candidatus Poribacteria bacterium]|nr:hypothetical protein [Candidatus Poribacteria bacterium]MDP6750051.1 hypothetical protein [Candidatus Poribacteria bacterium]MDP6996710.1 hypothetical protein [Candidatus Poribacteria bacterium]
MVASNFELCLDYAYYSRPVGRPGGFLPSASEIYFKRAGANTFYFFCPFTGRISN